MITKKRRRQRISLVIFVALVTAVIVAVSVNSNRSDAEIRARLLAQEWDFSSENEGTYASYLDALNTENRVNKPDSGIITVQAGDYVSVSDETLIAAGDEGIVTYSGSSVSYEFDVVEAGTYNIEVGYLPVADGNLTILRNVYINGELPFEGARGLTFDRRWVDADRSFFMKTDRNQGFPSQVQAPVYTSTRLESSDRSTTGPFLFYFDKGKNVVTLEATQSTLEITYISLVPSDGLMSYSEYLSDHSDAAYADSSMMGGEAISVVQAEDTAWKSSSVLLPQNDRTSAVTVPHHYSNIVLNTIGGNSWDQAGTSITWKLDVPADGLYRIATRFMQVENRDFYSGREIKINGEVPFTEAGSVAFYYDSRFQVEYLGNEEGAFYFYLEEGENYLTLTVTLGDLTYASSQTAISVRNFNTLHRELTAIMGNTPDTYRDYNILSSVPEMVDVLSREYVRLTSIMESVGDTLEENTTSRSIAKFLLQIEKLVRKPDSIAKEYATFSDNLTAVADWMLSLDEQPLQLDYIMLCGSDAELPRAEGNIFQNIAHSFMGFIGSFTNDYMIRSEAMDAKDKKIVVWIATSTRDQYDIAQRMINNAFKDSSFGVELKMVGAGTVMPATLTGNGPDVAIQLDYSMPTNFAYRDAGYNLRQFSDYDEVAARFAPGALEYFEYEGGSYALPDEMSFPVMFYRTDILNELGLEVPKTWDELIAMIPYLTSDNMSVYFSYGTSLLGGATSTSSKPMGLLLMSQFYQNGVELYRKDGAEINLDILDAELVFKKWVEYWTKQSFDLSISTTTRFRTGEVPIIIDDYTFVNTLKAAAPEIEGAWDIAPIPGTIQADGTVDATTTCMVGSSMIVKTTVEQNDSADEAWEFIKWWTSADVQVQYAEEQKSILGDAADFPLANLEAVMLRAREKGTDDTIEKILGNLRGVPQVPGGYIVGREVENAFLEAVTELNDPVDSLYSKIRRINTELTGKRREFGLPTSED